MYESYKMNDRAPDRLSLAGRKLIASGSVTSQRRRMSPSSGHRLRQFLGDGTQGGGVRAIS